jgi:ferredoxin-NADP reductase
MSLFKQLVIRNIISETSDTKTFVLDPKSADDFFEYQSGQFLTLVFHTKQGDARRSFSISSSSVVGEPLSITVKRIDNGAYSRKLIDHAVVGDELLTIGASGFFILPENINTYKQVIFFAAGSGITPVFSLIKTLLHTAPNLSIVLIYSNRNDQTTIFYNAIQQLAALYPDRFKVEFLFSSSINLARARLSKWLLEQLLKEYAIASPNETLFYICGPYDYMRMASIELIAEGVPLAQIHKEDFAPLKLVPKELPPDTDAHQVSLSINGFVHQLIVQYPDSILKVAKKMGLEMPYSCEAGRCGTCVALCKSGKVWMSYNEVLMDDEIAKGLVLTCTGYPVGSDVSIII